MKEMKTVLAKIHYTIQSVKAYMQFVHISHECVEIIPIEKAKRTKIISIELHLINILGNYQRV